MPVTPALLSRLRSLDDLVELSRTLGFHAAPADLGREARRRLGIPEPPLVRRAALLGRHGHYRVYGLLLPSATREVVAAVVERLARRSDDRFLLLALESSGLTLALGCPVAAPRGIRGRVMRVALDRPSRIAAEIIEGLAPAREEGALTLAARIADVLGQEGLTARFFRELRRLHERAAQRMDGAPGASPGERSGLALLFLTRVLFLYFIQAKGWLAGRSDFLPSLLDLALARSHSFHRTVFAPLCFGALAAAPGDRRGRARALGAVPFLNSGLFEPHALERRFPDAEIPNDVWRDLFDELFERFHFTVRESDDTDAVDPEMLGRVFEGLMARDRRRDAGAFYTPRPLLRQVVAQALEAATAGLGPERPRRIRVLDPAVGSGAFLLEALTWLESRRSVLLPAEPAHERRRAIIRDCLFGVDTDPMAVRLAELRLWLALVAEVTVPDDVCPLPNLDQNLRQGDSLLSPLEAGSTRAPGVAPHVHAVAEARAAYFGATGARKTALARRIREHEHAIARSCLDADLARLTARLADAATGRDLFGGRPARSALQERGLRRWREQRRELRALRDRIDSDDALPFFAWDVHFGDVMSDGGFDVVLGNPPWVRGERLGHHVRQRLTECYDTFRPVSDRRGFAHLPDLSVAFVERALMLAREGGVVAMVLPAKLLRAGYAGPLRAFLRRESSILAIEDRSHAPHGFAATVFPMVCVLRRARPAIGDRTRVSLHLAADAPLVGDVASSGLPLVPDVPRGPWLVLPGDVGAAVRAALAAGPALSTRFRPRLGVKTGANDVFLRSDDAAGELPRAWARRAIQGRDIAPYRAEPGVTVLAAIDAGGVPLRHAPAEVAAYLAPHRTRLGRRADAARAPHWALFRTELLAAPWVVIWRDIADRLEAAPLDRRRPDAPIPLNTCYGVAVDGEVAAWWLSAWLNSTPLRALASAIAERGSGGVYRFSAATVGMLPLPQREDPVLLGELAQLARRAADGDPRSPDAIDTLVARALDLAPALADALARLGAALRRDPRRGR